jgi:predicted nucleotidyltransferase component of viral defense system
MYWNIFDEKRYELLKNITQKISLTNYYMIGGTALSLQLGLRESFDFDFCVSKPFNNTILLEELREIGKVDVIQNQKGTCDVILDDVQISFFYYPNKVIKEFVTCKEIPNLKLASVLDIAAMKLVAIGGRGAKKDFFDLYQIIHKENISVLEITKAFIEKDNKDCNYVNTIMGLSYFEDAESELLPITYIDYNWEQIKSYFIRIQPEFEKSIENLVNKSPK